MRSRDDARATARRVCTSCPLERREQTVERTRIRPIGQERRRLVPDLRLRVRQEGDHWSDSWRAQFPEHAHCEHELVRRGFCRGERLQHARHHGDPHAGHGRHGLVKPSRVVGRSPGPHAPQQVDRIRPRGRQALARLLGHDCIGSRRRVQEHADPVGPTRQECSSRLRTHLRIGRRQLTHLLQRTRILRRVLCVDSPVTRTTILRSI